jgi:hypothetical protein
MIDYFVGVCSNFKQRHGFLQSFFFQRYAFRLCCSLPSNFLLFHFRAWTSTQQRTLRPAVAFTSLQSFPLLSFSSSWPFSSILSLGFPNQSSFLTDRVTLSHVMSNTLQFFAVLFGLRLTSDLHPLNSSCLQIKLGQKMFNIFPKHLFNMIFFLTSCLAPIQKNRLYLFEIPVNFLQPPETTRRARKFLRLERN